MRGEAKGSRAKGVAANDLVRSTQHVPLLIESLASKRAVSGSTHTFYRYPARFSPEFAREAIEAFTKANDLVLDPFMGGGTAAVEALAKGRRFLGSDISRLAHFVASVKTTPLSDLEESGVIEWAARLRDRVSLGGREKRDAYWSNYQRNLPWWHRRLFAGAMRTLDVLATREQRAFARCTLLRAAQWALDCKTAIPSADEVFDEHLNTVADMLHGMRDFRGRMYAATGTSQVAPGRRLLLHGDAALLSTNARVADFGKPRLILTSPPYIGVHVLYHRWQILGRRETPAPFWIANRLDGHAGAFYTFADRRANKADSYITKLKACFRSVRDVMGARTALVQLVAFHDPDIQLPLYLSAMEAAGLERCELKTRSDLSRQVPNRKWYARLGIQSRSSTEFLIVHRRCKRK